RSRECGEASDYRIDSTTSPPVRSLTPSRPLRPALLVFGPCSTPARSKLSFTHSLQNLHQREIDLAHLHVDADDLHLDLVPKPVDSSGILAAEHVSPFDEPIVVVRHLQILNKALDVGLDELNEQAEGGHAGHVALEFVPTLVRRE